MDTAHFRLTYDGPALAQARMDVRELAPALLAAGDLLEAANRVLNRGRTRVSVQVHASFKTGSFGIDFGLVQGLVEQFTDLFKSDGASALANAIEILGAVGLVGGGLIALIKRLHGRKIERVEVGAGKAVLFVEHERIEIELAVLALLQDLETRAQLDRVLSPLDREGIELLALGDDRHIEQTVSREERPWFAPPAAAEELLVDERRKMIFSIVSLAFKEDNKWRLHDGNATLFALIRDETFLARVDQNLESFSKGDVLVCEVHVRQWQTAEGARTEYEVERVLEHRRAARQIRLPFEPPEAH